MKRIELSRRPSLIFCCGVLTVIAVWSFCAASTVSQEYAPPEDGFTRITIDGDPSDWTSYPVAYVDPVDDSTARVDIGSVSTFVNDRYLYILVDTSGENWRKSWIEIYINLPSSSGWPPDYLLEVWTEEQARLGPLTAFVNRQAVKLGEYGNVALGEALELRIPLDVLDEPPPESVCAVLMYQGGKLTLLIKRRFCGRRRASLPLLWRSTRPPMASYQPMRSGERKSTSSETSG